MNGTKWKKKIVYLRHGQCEKYEILVKYVHNTLINIEIVLWFLSSSTMTYSHFICNYVI